MKGTEVLFIWFIVKLLAGLKWNCLQLTVIARVLKVFTLFQFWVFIMLLFQNQSFSFLYLVFGGYVLQLLQVLVLSAYPACPYGTPEVLGCCDCCTWRPDPNPYVS